MASKIVLQVMNDTNMDTATNTFDRVEPIPLRYGLGTILSTMVFFQIINKCIISATGLNDENPKRGTELSRKEWQRRNLLISWMHAFIVSVWDILSFYYYGDDFARDLIEYHNLFVYFMIAFSTGYFFYDFVDILSNTGCSQWEVLAHHVAVAGMFFYDVVMCMCLPFTAVALLAEVNSFFLHSRKLLQLYGWPFDHWLYRASSWANLISFPFCRFLPLSVIYWGMWTMSNRVPPFYYAVLCVAIFMMSGINIVLFWRLFKNDVLRAWFGYGVRKTSSSSDALSSSETTTTTKLLSNGSCANNNDHLVTSSAPVANGHVSSHEHHE